MSATADPATDGAPEREEATTSVEMAPPELTDEDRQLIRGDATPDDDRAQVARETKGDLTVPARRRYDDGMAAILRATVFRGLNAAELGLALEMGARYRLDPAIGELFAAKFDGPDGKITVWAGRDGLLKSARQTGKLRHMESHVVRKNDTFLLTVDSDRVKTADDGSIVTGIRDLMFEQVGMGEAQRGPIVGAFALVWVVGDDQPWFAQAAWDDYGAPRQTDDNGDPTIWTVGEGFTEAMMRKVPESIALRMSCGLTGLYSEEEVWKLRKRHQQGAAGTAGDGTSPAGPTIEYPQTELGLTVRALVERVNELKPGMWRPAKIARRVNGRTDTELEGLVAELRAQVAKLEPKSDLLGRAAEQVRVASAEPVAQEPVPAATPSLVKLAEGISETMLRGPFPDSLLKVLTVHRTEPVRESVQERHGMLRDAMAADPELVAEQYGFESLEAVAAEVDRLEQALRIATNGGPTLAEAAATEEPAEEVDAEVPTRALEEAAAAAAAEVAEEDLPEFSASEFEELLPAIADLRAAYEDAPTPQVREMLGSNLQDALLREALLNRAAAATEGGE